MKSSLILLIAALSLACQYNDLSNAILKPGTYKGTFFRTYADGPNYEVANVTITFTKDQFSGVSDKIHYPAICHGTYHLVGQDIDFTNACIFTANFDWSLILSGKYQVTSNDNQLIVVRTSGSVMDHYILALQ